MHSSFVRTRHQRKTDEESQKRNYQEKTKEKSQKQSSKRKYNAKKAIVCNESEEGAVNAKKQANVCNEDEEQGVNAKKQAIFCNADEEQEPHVTPSGPNEQGLRLENEIPHEHDDDAEAEVWRASEAETRGTSRKRGGRGPARAKRLPLSSNDRIEVEFNDLGLPVGQGSVYLSSYLGPLVREQVPYTLDDWRNLSDALKVVLWQSIQV